MKGLQQRARRQRGQGMTEYIIIVALIAIAAIGVVTVFGNNIRELFQGSAEALTGQRNVTNDGETADDALVHKEGLADFGTNE